MHSLPAERQRWLVTGVAGFIGSHLLESLLRGSQEVVGLDDLSTGRRENLEDVRARLSPEQWSAFEFREGDITRAEDVDAAMPGCERVLHQAALGSVPHSLEAPARAHSVNVTGFVHVLDAARRSGVRRVVYASSSAVYGDTTEFPAREDRIGRPLSPYGLTKKLDEDYAEVFARCYGVEALGLRYFNVFGPRQDPGGAYAAVVPRWIQAIASGGSPEMFGDGETTRDFCPVEVVVEANLRAALVPMVPGMPGVFNVGLGRETRLNDLFEMIDAAARRVGVGTGPVELVRREARVGDIRRSVADVTRARHWLGLEPDVRLESALEDAVRWYVRP